MTLCIKALREKKDVSQMQFAAELGVSQSVVANWETEVALPRTRDLPAIARLLGCSIDELFEEGAE